MSSIAFHDIELSLSDKLILDDLGLVVTIPSYREEDLIASVRSILNSDLPPCHVDIIILLNTPEDATDEVLQLHRLSYTQLQNLEPIDGITIIPIHVHQIPIKKAGVGLARKIAMDEAKHRLLQSAHPVKVITCYDADCQCEVNYLTAVYDHFSQSKKEAASIHFEHPDADLNGNAHQRAIYLYELHLRYFIYMQDRIGLPFAFHTVGSSMACTARGYQRIGGMNTRKAGEDFYFLQKFIQDRQCANLRSTTIYPSARESKRVPFGTGRAISEILGSGQGYKSYNPKSFRDLEQLVQSIDDLFHERNIELILETYPQAVKEFLISISFQDTVKRLNQNTKSLDTFTKAFYQFFDAFQLMKYLHYARDRYYPDIDVLHVAMESLTQEYKPLEDHDLLAIYRTL